MKKTILPLLLVLSMPYGEALSHGTHVEGPRKGFHIEPKLPTPKISGETATLEGDFCVWHVVGSINKNPKCRKVKDNEFETHAYWPDPFHEVAIDVAKKAGGREFHYSFATSQISASDVNTLTLLIESKGRHHSNVMHLLHFKARLDRRIFHYEQHKDKMIRRGENQEVVAKFTEFIAKLASVRLKVQSALDARPEVLGRLEMPVQVGNNIAAPFISSTIFDGYRLSLDARAGTLIEGDRANVTASIYDMSFKDVKMPAFAEQDSEDDDDLLDDGKKFYYQVLLDNNVLFESSPGLFPFNSSMSHNFSTQALSPDNFPSLGLKFIKYEEKDDGTIKTTLWGRLDQELFVANDNVAPEWLEPILPDPTIRYAQNFPPIDATVRDSFGKINPDSINLTLNASLIDGTQTATTLNNLNKVSEDSGRSFRVFGDLNSLPEGEYTLLFGARDLASNLASPVDLSRLIRLDRTAPTILLSLSNNLITNNPNLDLHVSIFDHSPKMTTIFHQDQLRFQSPDSFFDLSTPLIEGLNFLRAESIDAASNVAIPQTVVIELDTIPPQILNLTPASGTILNTLAFTVSGSSNEILSQVLVNNQLALLSEDKKSFSLPVSAAAEGPFSYPVVMTDLAGNTSQINVNTEIVLKVLVAELIKVEPNSMGTKLLIIGAYGATRPGLTVYADAGLFNKNSAIANANGSFQIEMSPFSSATVTATSTELNRTDSVVLNYSVDTSLSGVVRDTNDLPLPGATVTIADSGQAAITDASGNFRIIEPVTGDQMVVIDGTTIPLEVTGPNRKFSKTVVKVSIGVVQSNVIERPIYLAPLMFDGSETEIVGNEAAVVTSPHAPDVVLNIPAGATTFPDGGNSGVINMLRVDSDKTTIDIPEYAVPDTVIALEPSGTRFSEPVELSLPNENNFPAGMDLVILSKNSATGEWEIDGVAQVDSTGGEIRTKEGMGITHFSEIMSVPLGPELKQIGGQDRPGVDTFNGALTTSISFPSYKSLGENIAPGLIYKSSWARPSVVVTNLFDVPRNEVFRSSSGTIERREYTAEYRNTALSWIEPAWIDAQFFTEGIASEPMRFTGIPQRSVVSYAMDLGNLDSDVYPYLASFKIKLNHMVIQTRNMTATAREGFEFKGGLRTLQISKERGGPIASQVFPSDLLGTIHVQNKINSSAGRGWKIAGVQKILNPKSSRLAIEEGDGSIAPYTLNNTIETVLHNPEGLQAADISSWPQAYFSTPARGVKQTDLSVLPNSISTVGQIPNYEGMLWWCMSNRAFGQPESYRCTRRQLTYQANRQATNLLALPDGSILGSDNLATIFKTESNSVSLFAGFERNITSLRRSFYFDTPPEPCGVGWSLSPWCSIIYSDVIYSSTPMTAGVCPPPATGKNPRKGFVEGSLTSSWFNQPMGLAQGPGNTIVVADYGNNRVRLINPSTNLVSTIAGNGQTYDLGDGGPALEASMIHPMGVLYDSFGSLYISTENGFIRKVDTSGRITKVAGLPLGQGGILANSAPADQMAFSSPHGMVLDEERRILYVADTGLHRVVKIDLANNLAETVAGNGTCATEGNIGDAGPALDASLCRPISLGFDDRGNLLVSDEDQKRIRRIIFDFAETGTLAFSPLHKDNSSLIRNSDGSFTRSYRNGTKAYFNAQGLQTSLEDRTGRVTSVVYEEGRLISIIDPVGKTTIFSYSGELLESVTDPVGRTSNFNHDGNSLTQVIFPDGTTQSFNYNDGLLSEEVNQRGFSTKYTFSSHNRLAKLTRPDNSEIVLIDGIGGTIANGYTSGNTGTLKSFGTSDGQVYDGIKDAKNIETKFVKDINGYIDTVIDGEGKVTKVERNLDGDPTKIIRPDLSEVTFIYDPDTRDLLSRHDSATNVSVSSTYNSFGQVISETNAHGLATTHVYDPITGLETEVYNSVGQSSTKTYESFGLLKDQTNSLGQKVSFEYFPNTGNVKVQTAPDLSSTSFERDVAGNITKITNAKNQVVKREFDLWNRLVAVVSAKDERTEYQYQETGELIKIKDPLGKEVHFYYNSLNQMFKKVDQLGNETLLTFDKNGNLESELDPNGNLKTYQYDNLDRLVKKILPDNIYEFDFDSRGNLTLAKNNISELEFEYAATEKGYQVATARSRGLGIKSDYPEYELNFDFDSSGNRILMGTATGNFLYGFDLLDRQTSLANHKGEIFTFNYDLANRLRELTRPNGKSQFDFDDTNFLTSIQHKKGSDIIKSVLYERDSIGNRTKMTTPSGDFIFGYDSNNQLLNSSNPEVTGNFATEIFNYDAIGNRTDDQLGNYLFDLTKQRLTEDSRYFYYYDLNGNLTSKQSKTLGGEVENFIYNSENQLVRFERYENNVLVKSADYFYNALAQRVEKVVVDHQNSANNLTRRFVYHDNEILHEMDAANQVLSTYTHSGLRTDDTLAVDVTSIGAQAGVATSSGSFYFLKDGLGSITEITDSTGEIIQRYIYSAFAKLLSIRDQNNQETQFPIVTPYFTYTNREFDAESGLYYYRTRFYSADIGRFLSSDSYIGKMQRPLSISNRYIYTENDPVNYGDPSGRTKVFNPISDTYGEHCGKDVGVGKKSGGGEPIDGLDEACYQHDRGHEVGGYDNDSSKYYAKGVADFELAYNASSNDPSYYLDYRPWVNPRSYYARPLIIGGMAVLGVVHMGLGTGSMIYNLIFKGPDLSDITHPLRDLGTTGLNAVKRQPQRIINNTIKKWF
ncbi:MAG: hypothetical protein A2X86_16015 [Bdellovibrionales bacterium GWA2_49_15]|nr:MAG: hypothetical protein A2X86_16015 [Bdellovibrionales bacterium GWA2_49_15]